MKGSDRNKLILVIVLFILAAVVFAWQMGYLGGAKPASSTPVTPPANTNPPPADTPSGNP
jgi:hypothetical protein